MRHVRSWGLFLAATLLLAPPATAGDKAWSRLGLDDQGVGCLVLGAGSGFDLDAAAGYDGGLTGLWKSPDGGQTWAALPELPGPAVHAVAADDGQPGTLYASSGIADRYRSLLYKTTDGGATWVPLNRTGVASLLVSGGSSPRVYAGLDHEVLSSGDGGKTWKGSTLDSIGGLFDSLSIISLGLSRSDPSRIYAGSDMDYPHDSVYGSTDAGATWTARDGGLPLTQQVFSLAVDLANAARVVAGTSQGTWLTTDGGASWSLTLKAFTRALAVDPTNASTIYAGTDGAGVLVSVDGGAHWTPMNQGDLFPRVLSLAIDRTGRHLYAGTRRGVFGYDLTEGPLVSANPIDLSVAADGETGFLALTAAGRVVLGSVDPSGRTTQERSYGPYAGWSPLAFASSLDGLTRVLWQNEDGRSDVWLASGGGVLGSFVFPPDAGVAAVDVAGSPGGRTHVLARGPAGASLRTIDERGNLVADAPIGSYPGWTAAAISDGADGLTRLLWANVDGRSGVSVVSDSRILTTARFESEAGWTTIDIGVGGDGLARLLRARADGLVALRVVDGAGVIASEGPAYAGPPGLSPRRVSCGPDGSSRVLFSADARAATVWTLSPSGLFQGSFDLSVPAPEGGVVGQWAGTWKHSSSAYCDSTGGSDEAPAQAAFARDGWEVSGTLSTGAVSCGLGDLSFHGAFQDGLLAGSVRDDEGLELHTSGVLSGTSLEITIDNGGGYIIGQLHLHR